MGKLFGAIVVAGALCAGQASAGCAHSEEQMAPTKGSMQRAVLVAAMSCGDVSLEFPMPCSIGRTNRSRQMPRSWPSSFCCERSARKSHRRKSRNRFRTGSPLPAVSLRLFARHRGRRRRNLERRPRPLGQFVGIVVEPVRQREPGRHHRLSRRMLLKGKTVWCVRRGRPCGSFPFVLK